MITIYKVTNTVNGMAYVGQTSRNIRERLSKHKNDTRSRFKVFKLQKAMLEYGADKFKIEAIDCAKTKDEANEKEVQWIAKLDSIKNGYNTARGGKDSGARKRVMNVDTGTVYESAVEAAQAMGVRAQSICMAVKNPTWKCCGYHWKLF